MQMKDKSIAHIAMRSKFDILPQGVGIPRNVEVCCILAKPQNCKKIEKKVLIFEEKEHINTLRPKWDMFGVKWRYDATDKLENAKIEICLYVF